MRKSERIRLLELQMVRLEMQLEIVTNALTGLIETSNNHAQDLDAQKWYTRNTEE